MLTLDTKHGLFSYRRGVVAMACFLPSFTALGCKAFDDRQPQIQAALETGVKAGNTVSTLGAYVPPPVGTTMQDVGILISAIAGSMLTVDKLIQKSRTPVSVTPVPTPSPTTPKG